jgi:5'-nucleotidase
MKRRIRVLLDCDGLLSDFTSAALEVVAKVAGKRYVPADVVRFDFCDALGLSKASRRAVMDAIAHARGFVADMQPLPGAIEGVQALRELGDVYVVTSPWAGSPTWMAERTAWLAHHFQSNADHVAHMSAKHLVDGDLFVDDRSDHVRAWLAERPDRCGVFWGTRHNTSEAVPAGALRGNSWAALARLAHALAEPQRPIEGIG